MKIYAGLSGVDAATLDKIKASEVDLVWSASVSWALGQAVGGDEDDRYDVLVVGELIAGEIGDPPDRVCAVGGRFTYTAAAWCLATPSLMTRAMRRLAIEIVAQRNGIVVPWRSDPRVSKERAS